VIGTLIPTAGRNANYTAVRADKGTHQSFAGGTFTLTLPDAATVGNGWHIYVSTYGDTGAVTIAASGANFIDGTASYIVAPKQWVLVASNGANYEIVAAGLKRGNRFGNAMTAAATLNLDAVAGSAVFINGNTTISALTLAPGVTKTLVFTGTPRLVHGAALFLPGDQDLFVSNGATYTVMGEPSGAVRVIGFGKQNTGYMYVREESTVVPTGANQTEVEAAVWTRLPNTVKHNTIAGATLNGSGQVSLPPGRYRVRATAQFARGNNSYLMVWNHTTGAMIMDGPVQFSIVGATDATTIPVEVECEFTVTTTTLIGIRQQASNSNNSLRFGPTSATGVRTYGVFSEMHIRKEA
jgi:hypothetical protein